MRLRACQRRVPISTTAFSSWTTTQLRTRCARGAPAVRPVAVGRKNYLFMGSEAGGKSAAIAYTLIETAKMNKVNPKAWLAWVLERIQDHPANRIAELLPWAYQDMIDAAERDAEAANAA